MTWLVFHYSSSPAGQGCQGSNKQRLVVWWHTLFTVFITSKLCDEMDKNSFGKVLKQLMSCLPFGRVASDARGPAHSSLLMSMSRSIIPGKQYAEYIYKYVMLLLVLKSAQGKSRNSLQSNLSLRSTMFSFLTHHKTVLWEI